MSTLLIDNYDSYTYNVFHLLAAVSGEEPIVVHNDMVSWRALSRWDFDAIVLSPGPGSSGALARLRRLLGHPALRARSRCWASVSAIRVSDMCSTGWSRPPRS